MFLGSSSACEVTTPTVPIMSLLNGGNTAPLLNNVNLHHVVDEVMKYLEPPSHEKLTVESVRQAYTVLQREAIQGGAAAAHLRVERIQSILDNDDASDNEQIVDWIQQQADVFRALLLASFLLLEMDNTDNRQTARVLQSSVERCLLLLQVLNTSNSNALPQSRHVLLQAVLDEPLIPLDKQERQYMYVLQRSNKNNHDENNQETDVEEDNVMGTIDKNELIQEEKELLKLASRPVPSNRNGVEDKVMEEPASTPTARTNGEGLIHHGTLFWIHKDMLRTCNVDLYGCSLLTVTLDDVSDPQQQRYSWLLSSSSTCETRVDKRDKSLHLYVTACHQVTVPFHVDSIFCDLEFQVDTLSSGYLWVSSIQKAIQSMQQAIELQKELQREWKEEYDALLANSSYS